MSQKIPPPRGFLAFFSQTVKKFSSKFYAPVMRSCLHSSTNFCSIICNFDEVMPYLARPPSSHHMHKMSTIGGNVCWHFLTLFPNGWEFLVQILHAYYTFLSTLEDKSLFNYLQLGTKLCCIKCDHPACVSADDGHFEHMMVVALYMT